MKYIIICAVFLPMILGIAAYCADKKNPRLRNIISFTAVGAVLLFSITLAANVVVGIQTSFVIPVCGFGLHFKIDGFRAVYSLIAALMWCFTTLFGGEYFRISNYKNIGRYQFFSLFSLGTVMGIFLSDDFMTLFIFFELMSLMSFPLVIHDETEKAISAANTYLAISVIGGLSILMGMFLMYAETESLAYGAIITADYSRPRMLAAAICMLAGFGAKAGMFPLHVWLPKAHPAAPAPASALLSGILTKTGIFGIIVITSGIMFHNAQWGQLVLILGTTTMLWGAVLALFSVNLKSVLACSSMSQIGFILVGIGMQGLLGSENSMAAAGTVLHMVNHSIIKLLLFIAVGVIYMNTHKLKLADLKGYGRGKPLLNLVFLSGTLGICGIPLFSGYQSKTLLHESITEFASTSGNPFYTVIEWLFLIAGGITIAYMAKIYITVFLKKPDNVEYSVKKPYMNALTSAILIISALIIPIFGILPNLTTLKIADICAPFMGAKAIGTYNFFTAANIGGAAVSIAIGVVIYLAVVCTFMHDKNLISPKLDMENLIYRPLLRAVTVICAFFMRILDNITDMFVYGIRKFVLTDTYGGKSTRRLHIENELLKDNHKKRLSERMGSIMRIHMRTQHIIYGSFSFGLILACVGIIAVMTYLLLHYYI